MTTDRPDPNRPREPEKGTKRRQLGLGPAYLFLSRILGDRIPRGELGPGTVPREVLHLPLGLLSGLLIDHAKRCRNPRCLHLPLALMPLRKARETAIRDAQDAIYRVLWTDPDHDLVQSVRDAILVQHAELADDVSTGSFLEADGLKGLLDDGDEGDASILAAVLWASGFKGPNAEQLFRCLVPVIVTPEREKKEAAATTTRGERRTRFKARLQRWRKEAREWKHTAEERARTLHNKSSELQEVRKELEKKGQKLRVAEEEIDAIKTGIRERDRSIAQLERELARTTRAASALRRDLRELQGVQRDLQEDRGELAQKLAAAQRQTKSLTLELESVPGGADSVWDFLTEEENRIRTDQRILQGALKERADQEWTAHRKLERAFLEAYPEYREPPPPRIRPKPPLRLLTLGGSSEVGKSCYLVQLGAHRLLIDCGISPGSKSNGHPEIDRIDRLDALILTHAHTDHIGWVPALIRRFPDLEIYCSAGTAALLPVMLDDCRRHYVREMARLREQAEHSRHAVAPEEAYAQEDVRLVPNLTIKCHFEEEERLPFGGASIQLFRAGHIAGAASVLIEDETGTRIFFSGDFSSFRQLTVPEASWPEELGEVDLLVLESTYGNREHRPMEESRDELLSFLREVLEDRGGSVILASFALGRAQELLKLVVTAQQRGDLPTSCPVHVDGMIRDINPIYHRHADFLLPKESFNEIVGEDERQEIAARAQEQPSVIITTSGMLHGGPVVEYARRLLPNPRHRLVLTGYQDEGAPSRALRRLSNPGGPRMVTLSDEAGEPIEFKAAAPAKEVGLSSHADQPGLIDYSGRMKPKHIVLVHGEKRAQEALARRLAEVHPEARIKAGPSEVVIR